MPTLKIMTLVNYNANKNQSKVHPTPFQIEIIFCSLKKKDRQRTKILERAEQIYYFCCVVPALFS